MKLLDAFYFRTHQRHLRLKTQRHFTLCAISSATKQANQSIYGKRIERHAHAFTLKCISFSVRFKPARSLQTCFHVLRRTSRKFNH